METWHLVLAAAVVVGVGVDRAMVALERRGLVHWRHWQGGVGTGTPLLQLGAILQPDIEHVIDERTHQADHVEVAGDDDPLARPPTV